MACLFISVRERHCNGIKTKDYENMLMPLVNIKLCSCKRPSGAKCPPTQERVVISGRLSIVKLRTRQLTI
uniref:Uncharacterized protein n=1 Tax=Amphimedon queenslandica TaxID=400682 RepID=A0A1X7VLI2_AMPQE